MTQIQRYLLQSFPFQPTNVDSGTYFRTGSLRLPHQLSRQRFQSRPLAQSAPDGAEHLSQYRKDRSHRGWKAERLELLVARPLVLLHGNVDVNRVFVGYAVGYLLLATFAKGDYRSFYEAFLQAIGRCCPTFINVPDGATLKVITEN